MGFEKVGVIERITGSLAAASIPVLYVSTFSSDYVLVPSTRLEEALRVLHHPQAPSSEGSNSGEEYIPSPSVVSQHSHPLNVLNASTRIVQVCSAGVLLPLVTHSLQARQIERRHRHLHTAALIRLLLMPAQARQALARRPPIQELAPHGSDPRVVCVVLCRMTHHS